MAMRLITAQNAAAPLAPGGSFVTFDFDQSNHPAFALLNAGAPNAPPGCCLALVISWFHNWTRPRGALTAFIQWVGLNGGGANQVSVYTVAVFNTAQMPWLTVLIALMGALGLQPLLGAFSPRVPLASNLVVRNLLQLRIPMARCTLLVGAGPAGAHAVGVFRAGPGVFFFDPNEGEICFSSIADFANWFTGGGGAQACLGFVGNPGTIQYLQFN